MTGGGGRTLGKPSGMKATGQEGCAERPEGPVEVVGAAKNRTLPFQRSLCHVPFHPCQGEQDGTGSLSLRVNRVTREMCSNSP